MELSTGRKWSAKVKLVHAKLLPNTLVGTEAAGLAVICRNLKPRYSRDRGKERQKPIQEENHEEVEEV